MSVEKAPISPASNHSRISTGSIDTVVSRDQKGKKAPTKAFFKLVESLPSMAGKTCAVTGCTTGTGFTLAEVMIRKGAKVLCLNRPSQRNEAAMIILKDVAQESKGEEPVAVPCDLQSFASLPKAIQMVKEQASGGLDVICLNAGIMNWPDKVTEDGYDIQMQTNQLSHFTLVKDLWPELTKAADIRGEARVVMHGSQARLIDGKGSGAFYPPCSCTVTPLRAKYFEKHEAGQLGGEGCPCPCKGMFFCGAKEERYQQSKLANFVFTYALKDKCDAVNSKVKAIHAHPGIATTQLVTNGPGKWGFIPKPAISFFMCAVAHSTDDGAQAIIKGSCEEGIQSGDHIGPGWPFYPYHFWGAAKKRKPESYLMSKANKDLLWSKCEEACGKFDVTGTAPEQQVMAS